MQATKREIVFVLLEFCLILYNLSYTKRPIYFGTDLGYLLKCCRIMKGSDAVVADIQGVKIMNDDPANVDVLYANVHGELSV